jgi:hypothetical protein
MDSLLFGLILGLLLALILWLALKRRGRKRGPQVQVKTSIEAIKSVGELVVLKVYTKQIVTSRDHLFGDWGEKWMTWLLSSKKTAIVFEFLLDFRYDLRSTDFKVDFSFDKGLVFTLPRCFYEIQMKDMQIYDEKGAALVPLLLPEWMGQMFGGKFTEKEKNHLIQAAKTEAEGLAKDLTTTMLNDVRQNAEVTLKSMALGMGFDRATFIFGSEHPQKRSIDLSLFEEKVSEALSTLAQ